MLSALMILAVIVVGGYAAAPPVPEGCYTCDYNLIGRAYLEGDYCNQFIQCKQNDDGTFSGIVMCCPKNLIWSQIKLTCVVGVCDKGPNTDDCPEIVTPEGKSCNLLPHADVTRFYMMLSATSKVAMDCAPGTVYEHDICSCRPGGSVKCYKDPLLYFPFADSDDDIQCQKAEGTSYGDAYIDESIGALCLDGDGDFVDIGFLNNWFVENSVDSFTVSLWFKQEGDSFTAGLTAGTFGNGDCDFDSTVWLAGTNQVAEGGIVTLYEDFIFFADDDDDAASRIYNPEQWHHTAIRLEEGLITFFLNGVPVAVRDLFGTIRETQCSSKVGLAYLEGLPNYFTGCIDDLMVFDRYVSDEEMLDYVFSRDRTNGTTLTRYLSPFSP